MAKHKTITIPAFGQAYNLGTLVDFSVDPVPSDNNLFGNDVVDRFTYETKVDQTQTEYVFKDSFSEKASKMKIDGELSLSFACGLIKGRGELLNRHKLRPLLFTPPPL